MRNYTFPNGETLKKGDQVVIFPNPVMRGQNFVDPEAFVPERWNDLQLEKTYTALMFSQGPQKCPGKELALDLAVYFLTYIFRNYSIIGCKPKIDTNNVPQMINPCKVEFVYHSA
jgi:cytochrome P450